MLLLQLKSVCSLPVESATDVGSNADFDRSCLYFQVSELEGIDLNPVDRLQSSTTGWF